MLLLLAQSVLLLVVVSWYRDAHAELALLHAHVRNSRTSVLLPGNVSSSVSDVGSHEVSCSDAVRRAERRIEGRLSHELLTCQLEVAHVRRDPRHVALQRRTQVLGARAAACSSGRVVARRLTYVLPFVEPQLDRVRNLLQNVWSQHPPCNVSAPVYAQHVELVLYAARPLGADARDHARLAEQLTVAVEAGGSRACWNAIRVVVANLTRVPASAQTERYARKPVADQFFSVLDTPALRQRADYIAYFEPDTLPVRALWLDRLYEQVEYGGDFWLKGSLVSAWAVRLSLAANGTFLASQYRGPNAPLDFCYSLCGCAEHINGNAIHALHDERYVKFLRSVYRQMDFLSYNYDAFIMNRLKAVENWRFFQEHAHRFVYTEFIQHGQHDLPVAQLVDKFPSTYIVHQPLLA